MEYQIKSVADSFKVKLKGEVTFSENYAFRQMLRELEDRKSGAGVFDLTDVNMVDSAGLGMFLIAKEQADKSGWKLSVQGAQGHVARLFELTRLGEILV